MVTCGCIVPHTVTYCYYTCHYARRHTRTYVRMYLGVHVGNRKCTHWYIVQRCGCLGARVYACRSTSTRCVLWNEFAHLPSFAQIHHDPPDYSRNKISEHLRTFLVPTTQESASRSTTCRKPSFSGHQRRSTCWNPSVTNCRMPQGCARQRGITRQCQVLRKSMRQPLIEIGPGLRCHNVPQCVTMCRFQKKQQIK